MHLNIHHYCFVCSWNKTLPTRVVNMMSAVDKCSQDEHLQEEVQQILHVAISPSILEISNLLTYSGWNGTKLKFAVEVQHLQALKQNFMSGLLLLVINYVKLYLTILFKIPTGILRLCGQKGKNKRNQGLLFWTSMPWCRDSIFN